MTSVEKTQELIHELDPQARIEVDHIAPNSAFFNVKSHGRHVVIRYLSRRGFALWTRQPEDEFDSFGEKPQETFSTFTRFSKRLAQLLRAEVFSR